MSAANRRFASLPAHDSLPLGRSGGPTTVDDQLSATTISSSEEQKESHSAVVSSVSMQRLPDAVVRYLAEEFLTDAETRHWSCTSFTHLRALRQYRVKSPVYLHTAVHVVTSSASAAGSDQLTPTRRFRIGALLNVIVPPRWDTEELTAAIGRLPHTVRRIFFDYKFNLPVEQLTLPSGLTTIQFDDDCEFDQPVANWKLPSTLTELDFGRYSYFNQSVDRLTLPDGLRILRFPAGFRLSMAKLRLPASLIEFHFDQLQKTVADLPRLPEGLEVLRLSDASLKYSRVDSKFNLSLDDLQLPSTITSLHLGISFNRPLDGLTLPTSLTELTFDRVGAFKQSLDDVRWPLGLLTLQLPDGWNQPVEHLCLPDSLTRLHFGKDFTHPLIWHHPPAGVTDLQLGTSWDRPPSELRLPPLLKEFTLPQLSTRRSATTRWSERTATEPNARISTVAADLPARSHITRSR
jgi:hypothetical protein